MTRLSFQVPLSGGLVARLVFTDRIGGGPGGSSRAPFQWANLGSHVGDDPAAVRANRVALAAELAVAPDRMTFMHPDHGRAVVVIGSEFGEPSGVEPGAEWPAVDALITAELGCGLVALAADCVPIVLIEPDSAVVAAVHAGWRGVALGVADAAVQAMAEVGAQPGRMRAFLGPAICASCYPVSEQTRAEVGAVAPAAVAHSRTGQPALDLRAGLTQVLERWGIAVTCVGGCPAEDGDFFSYRRDGVTGRQAGAVAIVAGGAS